MGKVLVSAMSWGLGHVTRDIPLIDEILRHGHEITINTTGRPLELMKKEYPQCEFIDFDCYPEFNPAISSFMLSFAAHIPDIMKAVVKENAELHSWLKTKKFDVIISDNRWGMYSRDVPSFFITHQLRVHTPSFLKLGGNLADYINSSKIKYFDKVIVPDNSPEIGSISGKLCVSRNPHIQKMTYYAGILASVKKSDLRYDIDYLISISGPGPQRDKLEKLILPQLSNLKGKKVVLLGKPNEDKEYFLDGDTLVKSHAQRSVISELMNKTRFIISRSGYTTVMEIAELEKRKALFIPTPGQAEQEYLSDYYMRKGWFYSVRQDRLDLLSDVETAENYSGFPPLPKTKDNARRTYEDLFSEELGG